MHRYALAFSAVLLSVAPAAAQNADVQPTAKLPSTVTPTAYRIDFTIDPDKARFSGHTEIDIKLNDAAKSVWMHGRDLHVTRATVRANGKDIPVTFTQKTPLGLAQLDFGTVLKPGTLTLKFDYDAAFTTGPAGLYHINVDKSWYSWSQFESIDARRAFPSFDEPGFKTPFTVSIATKPGDVAVSNAPEIGKGTPEGTLVRHRFAPTLPLPTYLVALVTGPFVTAETVVPATPQRKTPLPLRVVGTKPNAGKLKFAAEQSGKIVALLENYFNQAFPYPKLDQIGSPVMPGAMENAGADIYGDGILFVDDASSADEKKTFGMVVAHELSHQWFGDLVTPAWWDDIWLNESFANWMGYRIGNEWRPDLNVGVDALREGFEAMELDSLVAGRPIHQRITDDAQIDDAFDQITYGKGGQVVGMIAAYLGEEKFRDGVRLHMSRHRYGNASTDEFFGALADAAHDPHVLDALRSFVDQQGVPVVTLHRDGNTLTASQHRYAYWGSNVPDAHWIIPFCARRTDKPSCTLVDKQNTPIKLAGTGPLVPNAGGWGYYRFELDPFDWEALIAAAPKLQQAEAMALTDSAWASFYAGRSPISRMVALARSMAAHPRAPIAVANGKQLHDLFRRGVVTPQAEPALRKLIRDIYAPVLARTGFDPAKSEYAGDDEEKAELRGDAAALLVRGGHDATLSKQLATALDGYLAGDTKVLADGNVPLAVSAAVEQRGPDYAKTLIGKALDPATAAPVRSALIQGIAQSDDPAIGSWLLGLADPRLQFHERMFAALSMLDQPGTVEPAGRYLLANFDILSKAMGGGGIFSARAAQMFHGQCTTELADLVDAKLRPDMEKAGSTIGVDRAVESIRNCARFRDAKAGEVSAGLNALR